MNLKKCTDYLNFLIQECDRHLYDNQVSEDEVQQLKIALQRFQGTVKESELPSDVKKDLLDLRLDFTLPANKDAKYLFGLFSKVRNYRWEEKKNFALESLKAKLSHLVVKLKLKS